MHTVTLIEEQDLVKIHGMHLLLPYIGSRFGLVVTYHCPVVDGLHRITVRSDKPMTGDQIYHMQIKCEAFLDGYKEGITYASR